MDTALVIGDSGGIGAAMRAALEARGVSVTGLSRSRDGLDLTDEASVAQHCDALAGPFDLVFVASGALSGGNGPEKALDQLRAGEFAAQMRLNALGPALVLKAVRRALPRDRRSVFACLSARLGSIGDNRLGGWYSYRASKAALNALIHGAAVEMGRSHRHAILVCLHPGTVATRLTEGYRDHPKVDAGSAAGRLLAVIDELTPAHSGGFYDYAGNAIAW